MIITKREYLNALKVVQKFKKQQRVNCYHFLYYSKIFESEPTCKWIKASCIEDACKKMLDFVSTLNEIYMIDYEVGFNEAFIDISNNKLLKKYIG